MFFVIDRISTRATLLALLSLIGRSCAHDHHSSTNPSGSLDAAILLHIGFQFLVWCILFPVGLIYGFTRARWHVPLQATGFVLTISGYVLGHSHSGRTFPPSLHGAFASIIMAPIALQIIFGTYLKLHINEGTLFRNWIVFAHRIVGLSYLSLGWMQVLFGMLVLGNICPWRDDTSLATVAQCAEPFLIGSLLMQYGLYSYLFHLMLPRWRSQSPETWDALILCISGIVFEAFNNWQLSVAWIGLVWFIGGVVSFLLSRNGRRTILPSIIVIVTGCSEIFKRRGNSDSAMSPNFGALLVLAGVLRVLEIMLSVKRRVTPPSRLRTQTVDASNWSAAVPMSFLSAGLVYMTSSEDLLRFTGIGTVNSLSYLAFMLGLSVALGGFVMFLGHIFHTRGRNAGPLPEPREDEREGKFVVEDSDDEEMSLRHGEAFELEGPSRTVDSDDEIR